MSWRRFIIYLSGLSKDSAFFTVLLNQKQEESKLDDPADIAAAIKRARKQK